MGTRVVSYGKKHMHFCAVHALPCAALLTEEKTLSALSGPLLEWYDAHRRVLPFRGTRDPYRVFVSEMMLQQTRTETVGPYYERFLQRFPDVNALALCSEEEVLKAWEGLGYYSRARNLRKAAQMVVSEYGGRFPDSLAALRALPGVGPYTAAAILSIAFDAPEPAMDGNLTRVLSRYFGMRENAASPSGKRTLLALGKSVMPQTRCGEFNQALMDLGATICTPGTPGCEVCPLAASCDACRQGDTEALPVLPVKTPPREVALQVALVTSGSGVLMERRGQALLSGLYVYFLTRGDVFSELKKRGVAVGFAADLGGARHVFTHLIWNMRVTHYRALQVSDASDARFYSLDEMEKLPIPTAMRFARRQAQTMLEMGERAAPVVVPLEKEMLDEAGRVYGESWRALHQSIVTPEYMAKHTDDYHRDILFSRIKTGKRVYAALESGHVRGVLCLDEETGEIMQLYIAPAFQSKGIGGVLLSFALYRLRPLGRAFLTVLETNARARGFYEKHGFLATGERTLLNEKTSLYEMTMACEIPVEGQK